MASGDGGIARFENPWLDVPYALLSSPSRRKLLNSERWPFTLYEASRLVTDWFSRLLRRTPGASDMRSPYARPLRGRSCTWVSEIIVPVEDVSLSCCVAVLVSFSVSASLPGFC